MNKNPISPIYAPNNRPCSLMRGLKLGRINQFNDHRSLVSTVICGHRSSLVNKIHRALQKSRGIIAKLKLVKFYEITKITTFSAAIKAMVFFKFLRTVVFLSSYIGIKRLKFQL